VFAVDHHAAGDEMPGIRVERPSCSEIALEIAREAGVRPSREALIAAALGIYADSVRLLRADGATLRILADAVDVVGPLEQYVGRLREEDRGLKMAKAHALARLSVYEGNRGVICATHVDAYESDVANALTSAGCDVSIVASRHGEEVRLILRSRSIDVAALAADIASILGGGGGGHRGAAAVSIKRRMRKDELPRLLSEVVKLIDASARRLD
ncbi:MAG: exopolyphosphatase, partial [Thermoproteus sp.]|nr:exopolyphosphatase [Thermoproteus sp.]